MTEEERFILKRYSFWNVDEQSNEGRDVGSILETECHTCGCSGGCSCAAAAAGCGGSCSKGCGCSP